MSQPSPMKEEKKSSFVTPVKEDPPFFKKGTSLPAVLDEDESPLPPGKGILAGLPSLKG